LIADAQRFSFYTPQDARLISGTASAQNLSQLLGIAVAPTVLQYVLVGDVPFDTLPETGTLTYRSRYNLYVWEGKGPEPWQECRIWFEPYHFQPVRFEITQLFGEVILQVQYEDFQPVGNLTLPRRIMMAQPAAEHQVVWHYTDVQLNTRVSSALFRMRVPPGTQRHELK
jgi:hypothetical protein